MASRADAIGTRVAGPLDDAAPARPTGLVRSLRAALGDAYFHSWRLAAANIAWSFVALALTVAAAVTPAALVLVPLLAIPTAAIFRITTRIARGRSVSFWDGYRGIREELPAIVAVGAALVIGGVVLAVNVVTGLASASPIGWALATLAAWGLVATWVLAWTLWPVLLDPERAGQRPRARLRLAALLAVAHPVRLAAMSGVIALLLALSTAAVAPLLTISIALAALWSSEVVLPAADRLENAMAARDAG
ncbi:MAG TPA: hypothetical protein VFI34_09185 [Candidatus Limnocylindrales bacterium]|nr:hypothetical protein [Candidatus Limnocylindrales bacterium]